MKTWEVNFGYLEHGEKKNALVKVRLCPDCSYKLNYHSKKREIKKEKKMKKAKKEKKKKRKNDSESEEEENDEERSASSESAETSSVASSSAAMAKDAAEHWKGPAPKIDEDKSKDEEFEDYLEDLFM